MFNFLYSIVVCVMFLFIIGILAGCEQKMKRVPVDCSVLVDTSEHKMNEKTYFSVPTEAINEWLANQPIKADEKTTSNIRTKTNVWAYSGSTLMHFAAAEEGRIDVMKWLKEQGLDINARCNTGETPMHRAAQRGRLESMKWLYEQGADIKAKASNGRTPMSWAAWNGHLESMKWLYEQGADIFVKDHYGWTLMFYASNNGHLTAMKWLKEQGLAVNSKSNDGKTPMHSAAESWNSSVDVLNWLKSEGLDINAKTNDGKTPFALAKSMNIPKFIEWFQSNGAIE